MSFARIFVCFVAAVYLLYILVVLRLLGKADKPRGHYVFVLGSYLVIFSTLVYAQSQL